MTPFHPMYCRQIECHPYRENLHVLGTMSTSASFQSQLDWGTPSLVANKRLLQSTTKSLSKREASQKFGMDHCPRRCSKHAMARSVSMRYKTARRALTPSGPTAKRQYAILIFFHTYLAYQAFRSISKPRSRSPDMLSRASRL